MLNIAKPKEIDYFLRDFTNLYKSSYENLLTKLYIQEDLRGESNYQYDILYFDYLFNTMYLLYIDYNRNPELGWTYFYNKYSMDFIKKLYRCRGINIDKVFDIFHLPTDFTTELEVSGAEIEETFVVEELIVPVTIPTNSKIMFSQLTEYCVNTLETCTCTNCYRYVEVPLPINNYLVCSQMTCDKEYYKYNETALVKFYLTNIGIEDIIIGVEQLLVNGSVYTDVNYTLQPGEKQKFTFTITNIIKETIVSLTNQFCQVTLPYIGGINDIQVIYNNINCYGGTTIVYFQPIGDNYTNITWYLNEVYFVPSPLGNVLPAGTYEITAIQGSTTVTKTFTITQPTQIVPSIVVTNAICYSCI